MRAYRANCMSTVAGRSSRLLNDRQAQRSRPYRLSSGTSKRTVTSTFQLCSHSSKDASMSEAAPLVYVIMGVSGCGKSTVGALLAEKLHCPFYDADDFHPPGNIRKMSAGIPLTDSDRWPWLQQLAQLVQEHVQQNSLAVLACSALKPAYRQVLKGAAGAACSTNEGATISPTVTQFSQEFRHCSSHEDRFDAATAAAPGVTTQDAKQQLQQDIQQIQQTQVAFVLLNPTREELIQRVQQRAASAKHFMPPALLDSQLEQLSYNPDELYMCFGGGCNNQSASTGKHHTGSAGSTEAGQCGCLPVSEQIVDAILRQRSS